MAALVRGLPERARLFAEQRAQRPQWSLQDELMARQIENSDRWFRQLGTWLGIKDLPEPFVVEHPDRERLLEEAKKAERPELTTDRAEIQRFFSQRR
jgi:hypothetical protein